MQVNGKQVDALQWLRDTGGTNAIKRFSPQPTQEQPASKSASDKVTISQNDAAILKAQMQFNKAGMIPGMTSDAVSSYLSQLKALQTPTAQSAAAKDTNSVRFDTPKTNNAVVTGTNNSVDFLSATLSASNNTVSVTGKGNIVRGYNGGQNNNTMTVTGDTNRLYSGQNVSNTAIAVKGNSNRVNLGTDASNNTVAVTGSNVKVSIGSQGLAAGSNQNWNINVAGDNIQVDVVNGKASVTMAEDQKDKYKITIDQTAKSVIVTAV